MRSKNTGLSRKITTLCLLLAVVICAAACVVGYFTYRNSIYEAYNGFAYEIGETALSYVDGNAISEYLDGREQDEAYREMADQIKNIYDNMNLTGIYLCLPDPETMTVANIYDVRVHDAENPEIYALGVVDPIAGDPQETIDVFLTGEESDSYFIRKSSFGYNTSAVLPVKNDTGTVTALMIVDVPMPHIQQNLNHYLILTISITAVLVLLLTVCNLFYLRRRVISPIQLLTSDAEEFIHNNTGFSKEVRAINTGDEIETLAKALLQMEIDLGTYIEELTTVTAEKERIGAELNVATQIQSSMLPCIFPAFPGRKEFDIYATMTPAKEVGGDFYDFFLVDDDHLALVMADVSGKGVPAALFMVIAKTLLKNAAQTGLSPKDVLEKVNNQLCENNEAEMFVTVWLGIYEISTGKLTASNAGHEYPAIRRADGKFELFKDKHGFVLAGMEGALYREYELELKSGDILFVYTDGVAEATNADNVLYGTDRMIAALNSVKQVEPVELLCGVKMDIDDFVGDAPQFDDITMLALKINENQSNNIKKINVPPSLDSINTITAFFEKCLSEKGVPMKVITQVDVAVDEIFSNIVRYSGATTVSVGCDIEENRAVLRFADNGRPYDPTEKADPDITLSAEERGIGGLGIFMVKKTMDKVTYEYTDGFNILVLEKCW